MRYYPERFFSKRAVLFYVTKKQIQIQLLVKAQNLQHIKLFMPVFLGNGNCICCLTLYAKGENVIAYCLRKYLISSQWICREGEYVYVDLLFHVAVILAPRSEDILFDNLMTYSNGDTCGKSKL